jgi:hypothetical protein
MSQDCKPAQFEVETAASRNLWQRIAHKLRCLLLGILRLRRVQMALVTIFVTLLTFYFPMLERLREDLLMVFASLLMLALGGYTVNDALNNGQEAGNTRAARGLVGRPRGRNARGAPRGASEQARRRFSRKGARL